MPIVIPAPKSLFRLHMATEKHLRIVFFGAPLFAVHALRLLQSSGWPLAAVVTTPDRSVGRRMLMTPSPVKTAAAELGIPVHAPMTLKDDAFFVWFENLRPDLCIVVAYPRLIPERYLPIPRLGFINIHPSLLPAYRGPSPVKSALLDGQTSTGVSVMRIDREMDHGPVLAQQAWQIPGGADADLCEDELFRLGARLLGDTLPGYIDGTITPHPQDHPKATVTRKFARADGRLDWTQTSVRVNDRIRALAANPGTWTTWRSKTLNIFHSHRITGTVPPHRAGTVFLHGTELAVACGQGALALETLQSEGGTRQSAHDFLNGHQQLLGSVLA